MVRALRALPTTQSWLLLFKVVVEDYFGMPWDDAIKLIDGYGLHPKKQKFKHIEMPDKLKNIQDIIRNTDIPPDHSSFLPDAVR